MEILPANSPFETRRVRRSQRGQGDVILVERFRSAGVPELVEGSLWKGACFTSRKAAKETPSTQRNQHLRATQQLRVSAVPNQTSDGNYQG